MNKQFFGIILAVIVILGGIFALTSKKNGTTGGSASSTGQPSSHVITAPGSKVTLVEYGDFQCPACKSYFPLVTQLKIEYKDKVNFQFRNFPLTQIHPNAFVGSRAAEAAAKQGKFFEMHDLLYQNQDTWSRSSSPATSLEIYAKELGLNVEQFKTDMNSTAVSDTINADIKAGQALGANSTPTFVINDKKIAKNPQSIDEFKKLLNDAIAANK
jgi:protein-disulfide isomerase